MIWSNRPNFHTPQEWLQHYENAVRRRCVAWPPLTAGELELADDRDLLQLHREWLPCRQGLQMLGLPPWFGKSIEPIDELEREQHLVTLEADPKYARAMYRLLKRGAGQ